MPGSKISPAPENNVLQLFLPFDIKERTHTEEEDSKAGIGLQDRWQDHVLSWGRFSFAKVYNLDAQGQWVGLA